MATILMITGDFVEDYENMVPFQAFQALGHTVHAICPNKQAGDQIITAIHDFEGHQTYTEKSGHLFTLNSSFEKTAPSHYDALYLPGGRAPEYLRLFPAVIDMIRHFADSNKPIGAICHGPQLLCAAGIIKGVRISAYPACRPEVLLAGADYNDLPMDNAITDGKFVTAPAWPAHPDFIAQFDRLLRVQPENS